MSKVIRVVAESSLAIESVNVFHWQIPGAGSQATEIAAAITAMTNFYNAVKALIPTSTITIGTRVVTVDQTPNQELASSNATVTTTGGSTSAVTSAAAVCAYRGPFIGARYRGRIFLGPLADAAVASSGTDITGSAATTISAAWATLVATTTSSIAFGVWSRTFQTFTPAVASSVRSGLGSQRRRLT